MIQPVLLGIGIEPTEDIGCGCFLEFDRGDEAQDVIPELDDALLIDVPRRLDPPGGALQVLAAPEDIESLTFEVLETRRVGDAHQITGGKDRLAVAKGIGGMDVAFDHVVVQQAVDYVGALAVRGAEHEGVP